MKSAQAIKLNGIIQGDKEIKLHFHAASGWINDPNGLCFFNGRYHMFFQHNPYDIVWGKMHWGHAVSDDLVHWEELPIAMYPDKEYEAGLGCFSGSALTVHHGSEELCHLFYTAVDREGFQTQCHAIMDRNGHIDKGDANPFLKGGPGINPREFRDPKVLAYKSEYLLVLGTGQNGVGRIVYFRSSDLFNWKYGGVLIEGPQYGPVIECPDMFPLDGRFVLVFSVMNDKACGTRYVLGDFDGESFKAEKEFRIEANPHFYAPQSFEKDEKRIQIGWLRDIYEDGEPFCGAMSIPRELTVKDGRICSFPIDRFSKYLSDSDPEFVADSGTVKDKRTGAIVYHGQSEDVKFLRDDNLVEIFIDGGHTNLCFRR